MLLTEEQDLDNLDNLDAFDKGTVILFSEAGVFYMPESIF